MDLPRPLSPSMAPQMLPQVPQVVRSPQVQPSVRSEADHLLTLLNGWTYERRMLELSSLIRELNTQRKLASAEHRRLIESEGEATHKLVGILSGMINELRPHGAELRNHVGSHLGWQVTRLRNEVDRLFYGDSPQRWNDGHLAPTRLIPRCRCAATMMCSVGARAV